MNPQHTPALFIWLPKCAGTTFFRHFNFNKQIAHPGTDYNFNNKDSVTFGHADIRILLKKQIVSREFYDKSFKFCITRNPYDRAVSLFHYLQQRKGHWHLSGRIPEDFNFTEWVRYLSKNRHSIPANSERNIIINKWINSQWNTMSSWAPKDINKVYQLEDGIESIIKNVQNHCELSSNSNIESKNQSKHKHFLEYYDQETLDIIYEIYQEDFVRFNYPQV